MRATRSGQWRYQRAVLHSVTSFKIFTLQYACFLVLTDGFTDRGTVLTTNLDGTQNGVPRMLQQLVCHFYVSILRKICFETKLTTARMNLGVTMNNPESWSSEAMSAELDRLGLGVSEPNKREVTSGSVDAAVHTTGGVIVPLKLYAVLHEKREVCFLDGPAPACATKDSDSGDSVRLWFEFGRGFVTICRVNGCYRVVIQNDKTQHVLFENEIGLNELIHPSGDNNCQCLLVDGDICLTFKTFAKAKQFADTYNNVSNDTMHGIMYLKQTVEQLQREIWKNKGEFNALKFGKVRELEQEVAELRRKHQSQTPIRA